MSLYAAHADYGGKLKSFSFSSYVSSCTTQSVAKERKYNGTPRQTPSNLYLSIIKDEVCHAEIAHPVTGFCCHSEGPGKVTVMTEIHQSEFVERPGM